MPNREPAVNDRRTYPASRTVTTRNGDVIHRNSAGQVTQVRTNNGTVVYHPPNAPRRIEMVRPGGAVVVARAPGHGYVQRQVVVQNTTNVTRTLTASIGTLRWTATGGTGSRTLGAYGRCAIIFESGTSAYISGDLT